MTKLQSKDAIGLLSPTRFVTSFGKSSHLFREMDWYVCYSLSVRLWAVQRYVVRTVSPCLFLRRPPQTQSARRPSRADGDRKYSCYNGSWPLRKAAIIHQVLQVRPLSNDAAGRDDYITGTALLSRPRPGSIYRNVADASTILKDGSIRAAVVWQIKDLEKPISELYIYDIPEAIYYEPYRCTTRTSLKASLTRRRTPVRLQDCNLAALFKANASHSWTSTRMTSILPALSTGLHLPKKYH